MLSHNQETCPFCENVARTAEGVFDVADGIVSVISGPNITREMLSALDTVVKNAYVNKTNPDELAKQADEIDPTLGKMIRAVGSKRPLYLTGLLLIIMAIKSCDLKIALDINRLIEQLNNSSPTTIVDETQPEPEEGT